ncbi:MAG: dTDP-4-dehydrorhamnose 3,5-epimerase family protein [Candidatus Coatesbacteria bacterium]
MSPKGLIQGVVVKPLRVMADERGRLMEILRRDDPFFRTFGQVYLTCCYPGVVKAWHLHRKQTDHFCVVRGMAKVVLYDGRKGSPTRRAINEFFIGELNPQLVVIPRLVMHGFKAIGTGEVYLLNVPSELYNHREPDEHRLPAHTKKIPYDWTRRDG